MTKFILVSACDILRGMLCVYTLTYKSVSKSVHKKYNYLRKTKQKIIEENMFHVCQRFALVS